MGTKIKYWVTGKGQGQVIIWGQVCSRVKWDLDHSQDLGPGSGSGFVSELEFGVVVDVESRSRAK